MAASCIALAEPLLHGAVPRKCRFAKGFTVMALLICSGSAMFLYSTMAWTAFGAIAMASTTDDLDESDEESKRRQMMNLGLPDDGYDYLQHLAIIEDDEELFYREGGNNLLGNDAFASQYAQYSIPRNGPCEPTPAPPDIRAYDARSLRVRKMAQNEGEALKFEEIAAFTEPVRDQAIIASLAAEMPNDEDDSDLEELQDNFIIQACQTNEARLKEMTSQLADQKIDDQQDTGKVSKS